MGYTPAFHHHHPPWTVRLTCHSIHYRLRLAYPPFYGPGPSGQPRFRGYPTRLASHAAGGVPAGPGESILSPRGMTTNPVLAQYEEFLEPLLEMVRAFADQDSNANITEWNLIQSLQDPERSNCIVVVCPSHRPPHPTLLWCHHAALCSLGLNAGTPAHHLGVHPHPHRLVRPILALPADPPPTHHRGVLQARSRAVRQRSGSRADHGARRSTLGRRACRLP